MIDFVRGFVGDHRRDGVFFINKHHLGLHGRPLFIRCQRQGQNDDFIPNLEVTGRRSVQANRSGCRVAGDGVCVPNYTVGKVSDLDHFIGQYLRRVHEGFIDGDAAHVVQICLCDRSSMDFPLTYGSQQRDSSSLSRPMHNHRCYPVI